MGSNVAESMHRISSGRGSDQAPYLGLGLVRSSDNQVTCGIRLPFASASPTIRLQAMRPLVPPHESVILQVRRTTYSSGSLHPPGLRLIVPADEAAAPPAEEEANHQVQCQDLPSKPVAVLTALLSGRLRLSDGGAP